MSISSAPGAARRAPVVLAFDTAASACSVALGLGDAMIAHERREMRHGHAEALLPMIDRVMATAALNASAIELVAVSVGPGGFTGIRAGLAAAQGLALATQARIVGVTSFAAVAALASPPGHALLVALDSRREEFYAQLFAADGLSRDPPRIVSPGELQKFVEGAIGGAPMSVAGDAAEAAVAALRGRTGVAALPGSAPDAAGVLAAAAACGGNHRVPARPLYLRPADVSVPKAGKGFGKAW